MQLVRTAICLMAAICAPPAVAADSFHPQIPKTWEDAEINSVEIPLSHPEHSPKHAPADFYYRMPVRPIYQSYPVYHPDREPLPEATMETRRGTGYYKVPSLLNVWYRTPLGHSR